MSELANISDGYKIRAIDYATKATQHATKAVEYALLAGEMLIQVKEELPYGQFGSWIKANMPVTRKQCNRYEKAYIASCNPRLQLKNNIGIQELISAQKDFEYKTRMVASRKLKALRLSERTPEEVASDAAKDAAESNKIRSELVNAFGGSLKTQDTMVEILDKRPELKEKVRKLLLQYLHPDKDTGDADMFDTIMQAFK